MPEPSPAYLWYPKDVMSSGRVAALTAVEELWYRRALDQSWLHVGMPSDPREFAGWVGRKCTVAAAKKIIEQFFDHRMRNSEKVFNKKQEKLRRDLKEKLRKRKEAGRLSGVKRRKKRDLTPEQSSNNARTNEEQNRTSSSSSSFPISSNTEADSNESARAEPNAVFTHPALAAIRIVTKTNPPKPIWNRLCSKLGTDVDIGRLTMCYTEWVARGYKEKNYGWAEDWYVTGIPEKEQRHGKGSHNGGKRTDKQVLAESREQFKRKYGSDAG